LGTPRQGKESDASAPWKVIPAREFDYYYYHIVISDSQPTIATRFDGFVIRLGLNWFGFGSASGSTYTSPSSPENSQKPSGNRIGF
jgi:hypothetical protein